MDNIIDNPDKNWNWYGISCNKNITMDIINKLKEKDFKQITIQYL